MSPVTPPCSATHPQHKGQVGKRHTTQCRRCKWSANKHIARCLRWHDCANINLPRDTLSVPHKAPMFCNPCRAHCLRLTETHTTLLEVQVECKQTHSTLPMVPLVVRIATQHTAWGASGVDENTQPTASGANGVATHTKQPASGASGVLADSVRGASGKLISRLLSGNACCPFC